MSAERILVVDDEREIGELVRDYLERDGYAVRVALDGASGMSMFRSFQPHLAILDIMLPGQNGQELCRQIRAESDIPVLMLSARDGDVDKVLSLGLGADDYLTKPFSPTELVARVKAHLRRFAMSSVVDVSGTGERSAPPIGRRTRPGRIAYPGLEVDLSARSAYVDGAEISLSAKEFDLLAFFARNPGQVFTREDLIAHVWRESPYVDTNTVTVHVQRIRERTGENSSDPRFIQTVWGVGYKFVVKS